MKILVTGGAGYIGSTAVKKLISENHQVVVIDNLSNSKKESVHQNAIFYEGDLMDNGFLETVFSQNNFDAVIHFAAYKDAAESMTNIEKYSQNIMGTINLLDVMAKYNVKKIIFSSSAAVYGDPKYTPVDELHPTNPTNYYGFTKLECERVIKWYSQLKGIIGISLRYFNVAGGKVLSKNKDIFSLLFNKLNNNEKLTVFGNNYPTRDGTCVRDYIDINDLIKAHILALQLNQSEIINLGTGTGTTVLELIKVFEEVTGKKVNYGVGENRDGDLSISVASYGKANKLLNWNPEISIKQSIKNSLEEVGNEN